jgi:hypothetical protein
MHDRISSTRLVHKDPQILWHARPVQFRKLSLKMPRRVSDVVDDHRQANKVNRLRIVGEPRDGGFHERPRQMSLSSTPPCWEMDAALEGQLLPILISRFVELPGNLFQWYFGVLKGHYRLLISGFKTGCPFPRPHLQCRDTRGPRLDPGGGDAGRGSPCATCWAV